MYRFRQSGKQNKVLTKITLNVSVKNGFHIRILITLTTIQRNLSFVSIRTIAQTRTLDLNLLNPLNKTEFTYEYTVEKGHNILGETRVTV